MCDGGVFMKTVSPLPIKLCGHSVVLLFLLAFLFSCASVPVTERKSLHLVPDSEIATMSLDEYNKVLKKSKISTDTAKVNMVRRVGQRIAAASEELLRESRRGADIANYKWEFNLIEDDKTVNAWCMPGGKIAVYTGLLPITQDDNGLAVVMSHEVSHAIAKHGNERMSQGLLAQLGAVGLSLALSTSPGVTSDIFMQAYGVGTQVGFLLPYSRVHEAEADHIGLILMAKAGYDPHGAITLWQRMSARGARVPRNFFPHIQCRNRGFAISKLRSLKP